jgi:hypothetical protein
LIEELTLLIKSITLNIQTDWNIDEIELFEEPNLLTRLKI